MVEGDTGFGAIYSACCATAEALDTLSQDQMRPSNWR
jgi:hypothetical protein